MVPGYPKFDKKIKNGTKERNCPSHKFSGMIMIRRPTSPGPKSPPEDGGLYLPHWFEPSDRDVICGWAKQNHLHAGNQRFRQLVEVTAPLYDAAQTKQEKTKVIASLVNRIRRESPQGGGFIKRDTITGFWYEIGNDKARDKVGHAIRRAIDAKKKKKRKLSSLVNLVSSSDKGLDAAVNLSALTGSSDAKPSSVASRSKVLSMPMKMEPLPALGATNAVASLPQNQPNPSLGQANLGLPLRGSVRMNALLRNDLAQNVNNDAQPVSSSSYIGGSGGRIAVFPHLSGLGNLFGGNDGMNSAAMQLRRQSLGQTSDFGSASLNRLLSQPESSLQKQLLGLSGPMTFQDQTMLNPIGAPNESTLQLPDSSDTTFFPTDSTAMEQLFSTLKPTPIGPRSADAGTTTRKEEHKGKKKESSSFPDRSSPHTNFDFLRQF